MSEIARTSERLKINGRCLPLPPPRPLSFKFSWGRSGRAPTRSSARFRSVRRSARGKRAGVRIVGRVSFIGGKTKGEEKGEDNEIRSYRGGEDIAGIISSRVDPRSLALLAFVFASALVLLRRDGSRERYARRLARRCDKLLNAAGKKGGRGWLASFAVRGRADSRREESRRPEEAERASESETTP